MPTRILLAFALLAAPPLQAGPARPNILWLSAEDISPHFGCYGDPHAITPAVDQLAEEGVRYTHAFTTAGVCAPCRSGIITGMYQTSIGTQHMRCTATLPDFIKPFPVYLREAGYYCTNNSKTDYQFAHSKNTWDVSSTKAHWRNRKDPAQPFFAVFNFTGCHESGIADESKYTSVTSSLSANERQDPNKLTTLPPYYPNTPTVREDWKRNYELITALDHWIADLLSQLKKDGLYENTIVMFWSDHGVGLPRAKRWLYDSGTRIPLVIRIPEKFRTGDQGKSGTVTDQLVSSIDFGPTVLNLAGVEIPDHVQGQPFLGKGSPAPREYVYGARDRMDERYDIIRSVRDKRFRYIRNYEPLKPYYQYMNTPEKGATMKQIRSLDRTELAAPVIAPTPLAVALFLAPNKPTEELYDLDSDPHEIKNLAADPATAETLTRLRDAHTRWLVETKDTGLIPEPILEIKAKSAGSQYEVLRQPDGDALNARLVEIAAAASSGPGSLPALIAGLKDADPAIRYWAATGIGNIGEEAKPALDAVTAAMEDEDATVRIAAARAAALLGHPKLALPVLMKALDSDEQWVRLQAAIVLDELDEIARPAIPALKKALADQPNKYIIRVTNRALNQLEGTRRIVP